MEGAPICAVGIVFDTSENRVASSRLMGIVFDTRDGGSSYLCSGYCFRYPGWRELMFVQWVSFSIPGRTEEAFYRVISDN